MGYTTQFDGELRFIKPLTDEQRIALENIFDEDVRDHEDDWGVDTRETYMSYVDLEFNDDNTGMRWNGAEKTYEMDSLINLVLRLMREKWPDFGVEGKMLAQGESVGDIWTITVDQKTGNVVRTDLELTGKKVECPHCGEEFIVEE